MTNHTKTMKGNQENMKKKDMSIKLVGAGGGGLAAIVLLGGALALVTTFAFRRKQKQENSSNKSIGKEDDGLLLGEQGLSFLVPDSLSPHLNHHSSSNGTLDTQDEVSTQILLDKNSQTNVANNQEMDISEKESNNYFCDESRINKEEFPFPVADSSLPLKLEEVNTKNDSLEEVQIIKVNKESTTTDCDQVGDSCNDWQVPLRMDGNNQELVKAADSDGMEELFERAQTNQAGTDDDSHKLENECDENGEIILKKGNEPVEAAARNQKRLDQMPLMGGEECDNDAGIIIEKGEEVVDANPMILSEKLGACTCTMNGDQDTLCSDGIVLIRNETGTCESKKAELLLPLIDSSLVTKPGDNNLFEDRLVVEDTKILKGEEANEPTVQKDCRKVEDREQKQLVEAPADNKEYYKIQTENNNDKSEGADEISVQSEQQIQSWEECQKIHINGDREQCNSGNSFPGINLFQADGFEVQEFSFPPLDSPSLFKPDKLHNYGSAETMTVKVINPMEKDGLAEDVFAYQIMLENKPSVQSPGNDEMQSYDDGGDSAAVEGEETMKTSLVDIVQPTTLSEEKDNNDSEEDEVAVKIFEREDFGVENNLQLPEKDHDYNDSVDREKHDNDCDNGDVDDDHDEEKDMETDTEGEDNVEEVEESSETTGDSNAEAIWPDESVLEISQKVKDMQANKQQNFKEIKEEDSYVKFNSHKLEDDDDDDHYVDTFMMAYSEKLSADTTTQKQPTNNFNLKFWFLSLLVPFLLLLWLSSSQLSYYTSFNYHLE